MRFLIVGACGASLVVVGLMLAGPRPINPARGPALTFEAALHPPARVAATLHRACFDCHSNETRWPWYSRVPVVGDQMRSDVDLARAMVNFSEWRDTNGARPKEEAAILTNLCTSTRAGAMPLRNYLFLHRDARLAPEEVRALCAWTDSAAKSLVAVP